MKKLKVGLVGLMHQNFPGDKENTFRMISDDFKKIANDYNFIPYIIEKGIITEDDALKAYHEILAQNIDLLMVCNIQFASGKIIAILADLPVYLGLWSLPESTSCGPLPANSFCGMNMNSSILKEYLGVEQYKWFYGNITDQWFIVRFRITIKSLQTIKNTKNTKMAIIGGMADGFDNQYYDERRIYEKYRVKIIRSLEFDDIYDRMKSYHDQDIEEIRNKLVANVCFISELAADKIDDTVRLIKTIIDFKKEMDLAAIALNCWPKYRRKLDMVACAAIGFLNQLGIPTACEGDVYGMLSMYFLRQLSPDPTLLMDLVDFAETEQSLLFWHCGVGCKSLAEQEEVRLTAHSNPVFIPGRGMKKHAPVADMIYKKGKATVVRITNHGGNLFILAGRFKNPEKPSFDGSRGWLGDLQFNFEPITVQDVINTILVNGIQHHYAIALGDYSKEMSEIAYWLGLKMVNKNKYQDFLQN